MLGIGTNVLVRYLVGDGRSQYERGRRLIHREENIGEPVLVCKILSPTHSQSGLLFPLPFRDWF
jgi:hypothetical protein